MERNCQAAGGADPDEAPRNPNLKRGELGPADARDLEAFQEVSRTSRRAVAEVIRRLVRLA